MIDVRIRMTILSWHADGLSVREIAERLMLNRRTVYRMLARAQAPAPDSCADYFVDDDRPVNSNALHVNDEEVA